MKTQELHTEVGVTEDDKVALRFGPWSFSWDPEEAESIGLALVEASHEARH